MLLMFVLGGCSDDIVVQKNTNTFKKHVGIHKLWPKSFKKEALGPVLGIRSVYMKLLGTPWDPKTVKVGFGASF